MRTITSPYFPTLRYRLLLLLFFLHNNSVAAEVVDLNVKQLRNLSLSELLDVPITTASRQSERATDTPASVMVITKEQIEQRRYINLSDLLQDLPGVDLQRNTKSAIYNNITLHGQLSNNKFLILQDGVRIDSPTREKIPVGDNFPLYHAKQVEILYGPASTLYGADAFSGVINIITEDAENVDGVRLSSSFGSNNSSYHSIHAGKKLSDNLEFVMGSHQQRSDTADLSKYYPTEFTKVNAVTSSGKVLVAAKDRENYVGNINSSTEFVKLKIAQDWTLGFNRSFFRSLTSTGDKPASTFYTQEGQWNAEINTLYATYQHQVNEDLSIKTHINYDTYEVAPESQYRNVFTDFGAGYNYSKGSKRALEQQVNYKLNANNSLIGGFSYEEYTSFVTPNLAQPFNRDKPINAQNQYFMNTTLPVPLTELSYRNSAFYLQWQAAWSPQFSTIVGLRYDRNSDYENTVNPRLGLVYRPLQDTVIKLLYGEAFRAPSPDDILGSYGTFTGKKNAQGEYISSQFRAPNPSLKPEKSKNLEFSVSQQWTKDFNSLLNLYYIQNRDLISSRTEAVPRQFIEGAQILKTTIRDNLGRGSQYGADLGLNYQRAWGEWKWSTWGSYSFIQGTVQDSGKTLDIPYVARNKLKLGTTFTYRDKYFITPQLYVIDRTNTELPDPQNPSKRQQSPAYALVNLHLGANNVLFKNMSLNFDILNLLDRRYYNAGGSATTTFAAMPQQPRSLMFSLRYQF
jgi:outer membrane receptor protein involved in Fe transport